MRDLHRMYVVLRPQLVESLFPANRLQRQPRFELRTVTLSRR